MLFVWINVSLFEVSWLKQSLFDLEQSAVQ